LKYFRKKVDAAISSFILMRIRNNFEKEKKRMFYDVV